MSCSRTWRGWPGRRVAAGWERPALDPSLLKAVALTFVELSIVTAIALFFSTFSTPLLSAALTFGFFVAGRFSADLRNFNQVVDSPVAAALRRKVSTGSCRTWRPFDVRAQVVHGQPVPAGYMALTAGYGALYVGSAHRRGDR